MKRLFLFISLSIFLTTCKKVELEGPALVLEGKWTWTKTLKYTVTHQYPQIAATAHQGDSHTLDFHADGYLFMVDNGVEKRERYKIELASSPPDAPFTINGSIIFFDKKKPSLDFQCNQDSMMILQHPYYSGGNDGSYWYTNIWER